MTEKFEEQGIVACALSEEASPASATVTLGQRVGKGYENTIGRQDGIPIMLSKQALREGEQNNNGWQNPRLVQAKQDKHST